MEVDFDTSAADTVTTVILTLIASAYWKSSPFVALSDFDSFRQPDLAMSIACQEVPDGINRPRKTFQTPFDKGTSWPYRHKFVTYLSARVHRLCRAAQSCSDSNSSCLGQTASLKCPSMKLFFAAGTCGHFHFDAFGAGCRHRLNCWAAEILAWPLGQTFAATFDLEGRSAPASGTFARHLPVFKSVVVPVRKPATFPSPLDLNFQFLQLRHLCVFASELGRTSSIG